MRISDWSSDVCSSDLIELRLAAHMADVPALKEAFANGEDIHAATAQQLFGEVNRDTRGRAKTINFAILYGISRWGLAGRLERSEEHTSELQSLMRISYAVFCLKKKKQKKYIKNDTNEDRNTTSTLDT